MTQATLDSWDTLEATLTPDPATADLTDFVGAIVGKAALDTIQKRCTEKGWTLHAKAAGDKWYIVGMDAKCREWGNLKVGWSETEGHYHYAIKAKTPLYRASETGYKAWLWDKMQKDAAVLHELYVIVNGAYVGCDVYIDGPNASVVMAAVAYLIKEYKSDGLPMFMNTAKPQS